MLMGVLSLAPMEAFTFNGPFGDFVLVQKRYNLNLNMVQIFNISLRPILPAD